MAVLPHVMGAARLVRINSPETGLADDDLAAIADLDLNALVLPKATPDSVAKFGDAGPP